MSLADVAKLGQVSRPAVSNWRRRYGDFPQPVQETGTTTLFRLADIEGWMHRHGKRLFPSSIEQQLWSAFAVTRDVLQPEKATQAAMVLVGLCAFADQLGTSERTAMDHALREGSEQCLADTLRRLAEKAASAGLLDEQVGDVDPESLRMCLPLLRSAHDQVGKRAPGVVFEALLAILARNSGESEFGTPPSVVELMTSLAKPIGGTVYDPACGRGGLLYAASCQVEPGVAVRFVGQEISHAVWQSAQLRMLAHGIKAEIILGDSLTSRADSLPPADLVLTNPPFGKAWRPERNPDAYRWPFGLPPSRSRELAFLQHSISVLKPGGRALQVTPMGALFRAGAEAEIRRRLVTSGCIHAVIALPQGLYARTSIPVALWIVSRPMAPVEGGVLLIDATRLGRRRPGHNTQIDDAEIAAISECYRTWQDVQQSGLAADGVLGGPLRHRTIDVDHLLATGCNLNPARWLVDPPEDPQQGLEAIRATESSLRSTKDALAAATPLMVSALALRKEATQKLPIRELASVTKARRVDSDLIGSGDTPLIRPRDLGRDWTVSPEAHIDPTLLDFQPDLTTAGDVVVLADRPNPRAAVDTSGGAIVAAPLYRLRWSTDEVDPLVWAALITKRMIPEESLGSALPRLRIHDLELPVLDAETARWLAMVLRALLEHRRLAGEFIRASHELEDRIASVLGSGRALLLNPSAAPVRES